MIVDNLYVKLFIIQLISPIIHGRDRKYFCNKTEKLCEYKKMDKTFCNDFHPMHEKYTYIEKHESKMKIPYRLVLLRHVCVRVYT